MQEQVARFDVLSQMADERMQALNTAMSEHDLLHEEIVAKRSGFATLSDTASALMILVGEKEACGLADKVVYITDRYVG
ncbi:hypothetical protein QYM36_014333 [Artemia franciscana]|uniref:Uncharacterized protein n=1 Tax=Artemia franciscana TaxID=6661 RepID=A0AA88HNC4_ARTSF|nr:hypothetical protein QYM36_014333 [Artemia franciscana]